MKEPADSQIDSYDRKILEIVSQEGRIAVTELAGRIGLSKTPWTEDADQEGAGRGQAD